MHSTIAQNLAAIHRRIESAARSAGRSPSEVRLLPVTKSADAERTYALVGLGCRDLAENRMQALESKAHDLASRAGAPEGGLRWHFIGHLQSRKVRRVVELIHELHSLDRESLIESAQGAARDSGRRLRVWLQVDASGDAGKTGFAPERVFEAAASLEACDHLIPLGLMAMGPHAPTPSRGAAEVFGEVHELARALEARPELARLFQGGRVRLNMGMSDDLEAAVQAGSHLVRIGSALFEGLEPEAGSEPDEARAARGQGDERAKPRGARPGPDTQRAWREETL